jgi:hypothetical protein
MRSQIVIACSRQEIDIFSTLDYSQAINGYWSLG